MSKEIAFTQSSSDKDKELENSRLNRSLLMCAVLNKNMIFIVEKAIRTPDIDLNAQDNDGNTALHLAAIVSNNEALGMLANACGRIDLNCKNKLEKTALDILVQLENAKGVEIIIDLPELVLNSRPEPTPEGSVENPSVSSSTECKR